jgi:predicted lipoprotein with Yx(FWY)xxD motif
MSRRWALRGVLIAALAPVGLVGCGSSDGDGGTRASAPTASPTKTAQPAVADGPASLKVGRSRLGRILVDADGRTLYLFTQDKPRRAVCTSEYLNCTSLWPPLMTSGRPRGQAGVRTRLLRSVHRTKPSGSQVAYNGHLVYRYVDDKHPGDLEGQGVFDAWYVLSPSGRPITGK